MPRRLLVLRLILPFTTLMLLIIIVCGTFMYWVGQRTVRLEQQREAEYLARNLKQWGLTTDGELTAQVRQQLQGAAELVGVRVSLIDDQGIDVFDAMPDGSTSEGEPSHLGDRPEVQEARQEGTGTAIEYDPERHQQWVHVAVRLPEQPDWILRVSQPEPRGGRLTLPAWMALGGAAGLALLLVGLVAYQLQRKWVGPIRALARDAEQMADGLWHVRTKAVGAADIRQFSHSLNRVAAQAEKQLNDWRQQRQDLQALVNSLPDPIIVTDADQRISLVNVPACDLLQLAPAQALGKKLVSVISENAILDLYERIVRKLQPGDQQGAAGEAGLPSAPARLRTDDEIPGEAPGSAREVHVRRNGQRLTFQAVVRPTSSGGVLLVLRNVSTMAAAVQMKADFVANASHELCTPIAAIKIAFETLRDVGQEDPQQAQRCIAVIEGHIRRLEEMLNDLLELSRVEHAETRPRLAPVAMEQVFATLRTGLESIARDKQLELTFEDRRPAPKPILSDARLLHLVLKNLVDNSIKFTPSGGRVRVMIDQGLPEAGAGPDGTAGKVDADGADAGDAVSTAGVMRQPGPDDIRISITDTGIGIAPEHLDRVFERFYQIDPARSGNAGRGTGLGLAIVKHAMAALGGWVELRSRVGAGTTITCYLPQQPAASRESESPASISAN